MASHPRVSFAQVREAIAANIESVCSRLLPRGQWRGNWYWAYVPWRDDKSPSLRVSRTSARWWDSGMEESDNGSTLIDLVARLERCSVIEAKDRLASMLGLHGVKYEAAAPRPKPKCIDCRHVWTRYNGRHCTVVLIGMLDEPLPTRTARRTGWVCGPFGKMYAEMQV